MKEIRKIDGLILTELKSIKTDITNLRHEMNTRFDRVDERFDAVEKRLFRLETSADEAKSKRETYEIQTEHFKHTIYEDVVFKEELKRFAEDNKLKYKIPTKNKY